MKPHGIWAEENTRAALFDAMWRKETFATSGPQLKVRFPGGWGYDARITKQADWVKTDLLVDGGVVASIGTTHR